MQHLLKILKLSVRGPKNLEVIRLPLGNFLTSTLALYRFSSSPLEKFANDGIARRNVL